MPEDFTKKCFVCQTPIQSDKYTIELSINLPVCNDCRGTDDEKKAIQTLLEGMADGFVCGCI